jgi:hypothetical protein
MTTINLYSVDYSSHGEALEWTGDTEDFVTDGMDETEVQDMMDAISEGREHFIGGGAAGLWLVKRV